MCITKPPLNYNGWLHLVDTNLDSFSNEHHLFPLLEDILVEDKKDEECVICLEEMLKGCTIARLPCLCIYHKQ